MSERLQLRVFISSVQKELASERLALQILLTTDPFLQQHTRPVLFEREPQPLRPDSQAYLKLLDRCQLMVLILGKTYGNRYGDLSATHHEYRRSQELQLPTLVCVLGDNKLKREKPLEDFLDELKNDGHTYDRFSTIENLQQNARERLIKHIRDCYHIEPTRDEDSIGKGTLEIASAFERQRLPDWSMDAAMRKRAQQLALVSSGTERKSLATKDQLRELRSRGYLWLDDSDQLKLTAAGLLLLGRDPSACFAHCRVQLDAFSGKSKDAKAIDHATAVGDIASTVDQALAFIDRNIRHPLRVVGLKRVEIAEYPDEAIREAIVNALAHRDYEDATRHVVVEVLKDRIEVSSPGGPPGNAKMAVIRRGTSKSRARNPLIAQGLRFMGLMEERGTGILRMKATMLAHGLDEPQLSIEDDYFVVTLPGPGINLDRLRTPTAKDNEALTHHSERQQRIVQQAILGGSVTASWCVENLQISRVTAFRELNRLTEVGSLSKQGEGRGTKYVPVGDLNE
ncbi:MAG: ATP-binding protein [Pirellula sp.]